MDKIALWLAAIVTTVSSFFMLMVGLYSLFRGDKILGVVSFAVGAILGSFIRDYARMIKEYR